MKKRKVVLSIAVACAAVILFLTFGITQSYLMDKESAVNVVTIGNVKLEVSEVFDDSRTVAAGGTLVKQPAVTNTGTKDEYVFLAIAVPKKNVTLLYEENTTVENKVYSEGTPTVKNRDADGNPQARTDEIFRILASGVENGAQVSAVVETADPKDKPQLDFSYNQGDSTSGIKKEGWFYLSRDVVSNSNYNVYYFGYNRRLKYDSNQTEQRKTIPLFDAVQLKSFIDEELVSRDTNNSKVDSTETIKVTAYGIQADDLSSDLNNIGRDAYLTTDRVRAIWGIVNNKKG